MKITNVPFPSSTGQVATVNASFRQEIAEFTTCWRFLLDSYNNGFISFLQAHRPSEAKNENYYSDSLGWETGFELDGFQGSLLFLRRNIPGGEMFLGGGLGNRSNPYFMHVNYPKNIETAKWNSFCTSYSSLKHRLHQYQDGMKVLGFTYPDKVENPLPASLFENLKIADNMRGMFTDLHIYSSFFEEDAMVDWTTGCDPKDGDIFKWDINKLNITQEEDSKINVTFVKIDKYEVCMNPNVQEVKQQPRKSAGQSEKKRFKPKPQDKETWVGSVIEHMEDPSQKSPKDAKEMCLR